MQKINIYSTILNGNMSDQRDVTKFKTLKLQEQRVEKGTIATSFLHESR